MKKLIYSAAFIALGYGVSAQKVMTPEMLLELGKISPLGISKDNKSIIFNVKKYNTEAGKSNSVKYQLPLDGSKATEIKEFQHLLKDELVSNDGKFKVEHHEIKVKPIFGTDYYPELKQSDVMIYDNLNNRHWDTWEDGAFDHVFLKTLENGKVKDSIDLMPNEPFDCPQKPFGGSEDYIFSPDGSKVLYVTKKKYGKDYAVSTNTDIFVYDILSKKTTNLTEGMLGYDIKPTYSSTGTLAFLSMKTDGYESDKNDIILDVNGVKTNITKDWDGTVNDYRWSNDGKKIFFLAPTDGAIHLFSAENPLVNKKGTQIKQLTKGDFDVKEMIGQVGNVLYVTRTDMNHAAEIYSVDLNTGVIKQLSHVNDEAYAGITLSRVERRYVTASDGEKMLVWVIYPPNFDSTKKYPTLLYCQGGPQSPLTQFYSFRWNFQLMAAKGYVVVAPNRRGMPGHGVKWNEQISRDYGGQNMKDYLISIDELSKEPFVDKDRRACVGASYGGYSVFFLAGIHQNRFKSFIAHDGIFDWRSMYGTTEEIFFVNQDLGGPYWDLKNTYAQKSYSEFNPVNYVTKWNTPIMIIQGGKDFRVPIEQGLCAFQAAQLIGLKSKLLYFPNENHWILKDHDALVWQREFYKWLQETLVDTQPKNQ